MTLNKNKLILIIIVGILSSCTDVVSLKETDLKKYPWLDPFISDYSNSEFKGRLNIDLGTMIFSFNISFDNGKDVIIRLDSIANAEDWVIFQESKLSRKYSKHVSNNVKDGGTIVLNAEVDTINNRLLFVVD